MAPPKTIEFLSRSRDTLLSASAGVAVEPAGSVPAKAIPVPSAPRKRSCGTEINFWLRLLEVPTIQALSSLGAGLEFPLCSQIFDTIHPFWKSQPIIFRVGMGAVCLVTKRCFLCSDLHRMTLDLTHAASAVLASSLCWCWLAVFWPRRERHSPRARRQHNLHSEKPAPPIPVTSPSSRRRAEMSGYTSIR